MYQKYFKITLDKRFHFVDNGSRRNKTMTVGDIINHPKYGKGEIVLVTDTCIGAKFTGAGRVNFTPATLEKDLLGALPPAERFRARIEQSLAAGASVWSRETSLYDHFMASGGLLKAIGPAELGDYFFNWYKSKTDVDAEAYNYCKYSLSSKHALQLQGTCPVPQDDTLLQYLLTLDGVFLRDNHLEINGFDRWVVFIENGARLGNQNPIAETQNAS
jgi:hypothetical protein